ncbi:hypothetical protein IW150_007036, partial [Coemansia sp. RSA 2607]
TTREARLAERQAFIDLTLAAAHKAVRQHHTLAGRAYALSTFIVPRFLFQFRFEAFTAAQIASADKQLRRIFWNKINGFLKYPQTALPRNQGGFGLPSLVSTHAAVRLQQVALYSHWVNRLTQPRQPAEPLPEWFLLMQRLWLHNIRLRRGPELSTHLQRLPDNVLSRILFDPFSQALGWARLRPNHWPPVWDSAFRFCHTGTLASRVDFAASLTAGASALRPAIAHSNGVIALFPGSSGEYRAFYSELAAFYSDPRTGSPFLTIATLADLAEHMRERSLTARTDATANCYACVAVELSRLLSLHISSTSQLTDAHRSLPYQNNWAYGPPKTHLFADAILSPTAPPPSPPAAMPAPAGFMADLFPVEPVPFAAWHDLGRTRRLLDTARPMPHPTPRIIGAGLRLPKYTAERTIWRQIKGLNATPQMRNTLHRLVFGHIPKRQDRDTSDLCACGAPETVAHLTGKCWAFAPLRA